MLGNVFSSPRTTLAGLASTILGAVLSQVLPQVVQYLGHQPGVGWQLAGMVLGTVAGALMADAKSAALAPKGFARLGGLAILATLSLAACTTLSALSGSTGPIPVSSGKDAAGNAVTTSSVTVTAQPVTGSPPACMKPVSVSFDTVSGYHNQCSVDVPVPPVAGVCQ